MCVIDGMNMHYLLICSSLVPGGQSARCRSLGMRCMNRFATSSGCSGSHRYVRCPTDDTACRDVRHVTSRRREGDENDDSSSFRNAENRDEVVDEDRRESASSKISSILLCVRNRPLSSRLTRVAYTFSLSLLPAFDVSHAKQDGKCCDSTVFICTYTSLTLVSACRSTQNTPSAYICRSFK